MDEAEGTIEAHYQIRDDVKSILQENEHRKTLIKLAILRIQSLITEKRDILTTNNNKRPRNTPKKNEVEQLRTQNNEYELNINKLKQEHSTQMKLQQGKYDLLKEEHTKLKSKLKTQGNRQSSQQYTTRKFSGVKKPSLFDISSNYTASPSFIKQQDMATPIKKFKQNHSFTSSSNTAFSPTPGRRALSLTSKTESPSKFIEKFEKSVSPISSPVFPHKVSTTPSVPSSADRENKTFTDDDYISANSSVSSADDAVPKKKKKTLKLWKSKISKISKITSIW
ncbi:hypothetical protein JA1_001032 [Spathaspora sp. JA1]|nr:hypothetical protein JA1_001032 [Spathaspora sp. JA1]